MTKFIASLGILGGSIALSLANYWFTYGLWPISWASFIWCSAGFYALLTLNVLVSRDE